MKDVLVILALVISIYIIFKFMAKEPLLPWKAKKTVQNGWKTSKSASKTKKKKNKKNQSDYEFNEEDEAEPFPFLFHDVVDISHNMIRHENNMFFLMCEVEPVNYFLLSQDEQEVVDIQLETWLATLEFPTKIYLQNRFIDLSEPIENMVNNMGKENNLHENTLTYGRSVIEDIQRWQNAQPRYETKRYIIFPYDSRGKDISAETEEEYESRLVDKAFSELFRRYSSTSSVLSKSGAKVHLLATEGIFEVQYHALNRKKALKNRFVDIERGDMMTLYLTGDTTEKRLEQVKEAIRIEKEQEEPNYS